MRASKSSVKDMSNTSRLSRDEILHNATEDINSTNRRSLGYDWSADQILAVFVCFFYPGQLHFYFMGHSKSSPMPRSTC